MSEIKYATILLTDIFSVGRGLPKYTRSYADKHKGIYPVYSSKTDDDGVFATINTYDYDGEYLTWSTDGYAGVPAYRKKWEIFMHRSLLNISIKPRFRECIFTICKISN